VYGGEFIAGGGFVLPDGNRLARWTGSSWASFAPGLTNSFYELVVHRDQLYAVGVFQASDGHAGDDFLRWNGHAWSAITSPGVIPGFPSVIAVHGDSIQIAGEFSSVGGLVRNNWATLDLPQAPSITVEPDDVAACKGASVSFGIAAESPRPLTYRWYRDGTAITDGLAASGAVFAGSSTGELEITATTPAEQGLYSCEVDDGCTTVSSAGAALVLCRADFDCSGFVDTDDFTAFVLDFEAGVDSADIDGTGFVDTDDFTSFVVAFEAGC
jgi:hypothetical protein